MEQWLQWARGPFFIGSVVILVLGLVRVLALNTANIVILWRRSVRNSRDVPLGAVLRATLEYVIPSRRMVRQSGVFSVVSMVFHVAIIVTPIFLGAHILLWERGLGVRWPALGPLLADGLTLTAIATAATLLILRLSSATSRAISHPQDYFFLVLIATPFVTGFLAMHPGMNPVSYDLTLFLHVMSGNLIFILIPFTKISHVVLFPTTRLVSEFGWHLRPESGRRVALALGKEDEPI
jgi:nitrate reductase gamma subunit